MEEVGEVEADVRIIASDLKRSFIPSNMTFMVACPPGCVRGKVYFDSNAVAAWLRVRRAIPTIELFTARLVCGICREKPAEVRLITQLTRTRLATLRGMAADGRSMLPITTNT